MTSNEGEVNVIFRIGAFTTNNDKLSPIMLLKKFFVGSICTNINYVKVGHVEFDHKVMEGNIVVNCHTNYIELTNLGKSFNICACADCFIIMIDIETEESLKEMDKIIMYIKNYCNTERKIYILGFYNIKENKKSDKINEDSMKALFESNELDSDYIEIDINQEKEIVDLFEFINTESIKSKVRKKTDINNLTYELELGNSTSKCNIF